MVTYNVGSTVHARGINLSHNLMFYRVCTRTYTTRPLSILVSSHDRSKFLPIPLRFLTEVAPSIALLNRNGAPKTYAWRKCFPPGISLEAWSKVERVGRVTRRGVALMAVTDMIRIDIAEGDRDRYCALRRRTYTHMVSATFWDFLTPCPSCRHYLIHGYCHLATMPRSAVKPSNVDWENGRWQMGELNFWIFSGHIH